MKIEAEVVSDEALLATVEILGCWSAAAQAIAERERRRGLGEDVVVLWDRDRGVLLVGPPLKEGA